MREHLNLTNYRDGCNLLDRPCLFKIFGCNFEGINCRLGMHEQEERQYHYYLLCQLGYGRLYIPEATMQLSPIVMYTPAQFKH